MIACCQIGSFTQKVLNEIYKSKQHFIVFMDPCKNQIRRPTSYTNIRCQSSNYRPTIITFQEDKNRNRSRENSLQNLTYKLNTNFNNLNQKDEMRRNVRVNSNQNRINVTNNSYPLSQKQINIKNNFNCPKQNLPPRQNKIPLPPLPPNIKYASNLSNNQNAKVGPSIQQYVSKCFESLNKFKEYLRSFSRRDFQQFVILYQQYTKLDLISKQNLKNQIARLKQYQEQANQGSVNHHTFLKEVLIVDSALYYTSDKHRLRATQILAIYLFLYRPEVKRLLLQILTGEGKSTTIACMAAILAMRGQNVDIITTSKILAQRDAEVQSQFFSLMGLECSHNITQQTREGHEQTNRPRKCYEKFNVVYGTPFYYQVDLLLTQYQKKGTRNNRPYDIVIIDEVDSMLLDEKSNQTILSSNYAGYYDLLEVLRIIWQTIITNTIIKDINNQMHVLIDGKDGSIIKAKIRYAIFLILNDIKEKFPGQIISRYKHQFINYSLEKWIQNALDAAFFRKQNKHYVVQNQKIVPVDFENTGCYQRGVSWDFGLHQFLQMKHGLDVSIQSVTSNYISNMGHFSRYNKIYGLTGTLGSQQSMKFLQNIYGVQMFEIPPFKKRILQIDPGFAMYDYKDWMSQIHKICLRMMQRGRAVLIICQSIYNAQSIAEALKLLKVGYKNLRVFITGEEDHPDIVDSLDIIVATNVAGRGTDFKPTKNLIAKGGLHVIITFMPSNLRVQMQARGRAGRSGAPGSSELVIDLTSYYKNIKKEIGSREQHYQTDIMNNIKQIIKNVRDQREAQLMKNDYEQVKKLRTLDKIFSLFCKATQKIKDYVKIFVKRQSIQQRWGLLLKKFEIENVSNEDKIKQTEKFIKQIQKNEQCFYTPIHAVQRGINFVDQKKYEKAIQMFRSVQSGQCCKLANIGSFISYGTVLLMQAVQQRSYQKLQQGIKKLQYAVLILKSKRQFQKGLRMIHLSIDSKNVMQLLKDQKQNDMERLSKIVGEIKQKKVKNSQDRAPKLIAKLTDFSEDILFEIIINHLQEMLQNLKQVGNRYDSLQISFHSILTLISDSPQDQQQFQPTLRKIYKEIPKIPFLSFQKKDQLSSITRYQIFSQAILQICLGALITIQKQSQQSASTVHKNLNQCIQILFPQKMRPSLKQYFSLQSIQYAVKIANAGSTAIEEKSRDMADGFIKYQCTSIDKIINDHICQIQSILGYKNENIEKIQQQYCSSSLYDRISMNKQKRRIYSTSKIVDIINAQFFRRTVTEGIKEQYKSQSKLKENKNNFNMHIETQIYRIIQNCLSKQRSTLSRYPIQKKQLQSLILKQFQEVLTKQLFQSDSEKFQKQLTRYWKQNQYLKKNIYQNLIYHFKIDLIIQKIIRNIFASMDFRKTLEKAIKNYYELIRSYIQQLRHKKWDIFNRKVCSNQQYSNPQETQRILSENNILDYLINSGCLNQGKVNIQKINRCRYLNTQLRQVFLNFNCNFRTCIYQFSEAMRKGASSQIIIKAYEFLIKNQININDDMCTERLKHFQENLYQKISSSL